MQMKSAGKLFVKYVSLNVLGMIALSSYILADTYFIAGGIGELGLAALNFAIPAFSLVNGTGLMLGMGGGTLYSILSAGRETARANRVYTQSVIIGLIISVLYAVIGASAAVPLSYLLGADSETIGLTSEYLRTLLAFSPLFVMNNVFLGFLRNDNAPRLAMTGMVVGSLSNVLLDYVFIFPLGLGMFGAALATCIAPFISLTFQSFHFWLKKNNVKFVRMRFSAREAGRTVALGVPALLTELSTGVVMLVFNYIMLDLAGNVGVAAYGVTANIAIVVIGVFTGIAQGSQPVESMYYGKGDRRNLHKILIYAIGTAVAVGAVVYTVCGIFAEEIAALFNRQQAPNLTEIASGGMRLYFISFLPAGVSIILSNYMSATDQPRPAFAVTLTRGWIAIIPMAFLMSSLAGVTGAWLSFVVAETIGLILAIICISVVSRKETFLCSGIPEYRRARYTATEND